MNFYMVCMCVCTYIFEWIYAHRLLPDDRELSAALLAVGMYVCMCVYVYKCMLIYIYTLYVCMCVHIYGYIYLYVCICTYISAR